MPEKLKSYIFLIPAVLLLLYTAVRAYRLSFTIDEASTFIYLCQGTYNDILHPKWIDANNHVLNTFAMKFFSSWLPLSEFTLRIQSVIAHITFLVFTWLLLKDFKNTWQKLALYIIININPYMLDFFFRWQGDMP